MKRGEKEGKRKGRKVKGRGKAEQIMGKREKRVRTTAVWKGKREGKKERWERKGRAGKSKGTKKER